MELSINMKKYPNKLVIMPFWISILMTELPNKMNNKHNKYVIIKKTVLKRVCTKNPWQTKELTERAGKWMYKFLKIRNSCLYENFYS